MTHRQKENENPDLDEFNDLLMKAFAFADDNNLEWQQAMVYSAYHLVEYGNWRSKTDVTQVSALMLYAMKKSLMRRMNDDSLRDASAELSFSIEASPQINGREAEAATLIISAAQAAIEQLFKGKGVQFGALH